MSNIVDVEKQLEALIKYKASLQYIDWSGANEKSWSLALSRLVQTEVLEDVQYYAKLVSQQFPLDRHAQFVSALSRQALQFEPAIRFEERADRDYLPFVVPGSDVAIFVFCGSANMVGFPLKFAHRLFGSFNATVIYLFDETKSFYFNGLASVPGGFADTIDFIKAQLATLGIEQVFCYGTSLGSYAAIRVGVALEAKTVLCCAGPTNLTVEFLLEHNIHEKRLPLVLAESENALDMRMLLLQCAHPPHITMLYGEDNVADKLQAENLKGLANVRLVAWKGVSDHNIIREVVLANSWYATLDAWLSCKSV